MFAQNSIRLIKAQTYPQANIIIGSFVISRVNTELLKHVKDQLSTQFCKEEMGNGGFKSFVRPDVNELDFSLQPEKQGSLPAIRLKAVKNDLLRYALQEVFGTLNFEVTVSRITEQRNKYEDRYYIKFQVEQMINQKLINKLKNLLIGNKL